MYYVCIENSRIVSILNYAPNVPESIKVAQLSDEDHAKITQHNPTVYFDATELRIKPMPQNVIDGYNSQDDNVKNLELLNSTDWKVLRHIREKALGTETSLTEDEYIELEESRAMAAAAITHK